MPSRHHPMQLLSNATRDHRSILVRPWARRDKRPDDTTVHTHSPTSSSHTAHALQTVFSTSRNARPYVLASILSPTKPRPYRSLHISTPLTHDNVSTPVVHALKCPFMYRLPAPCHASHLRPCPGTPRSHDPSATARTSHRQTPQGPVTACPPRTHTNPAFSVHYVADVDFQVGGNSTSLLPITLYPRL